MLKRPNFTKKNAISSICDKKVFQKKDCNNYIVQDVKYLRQLIYSALARTKRRYNRKIFALQKLKNNRKISANNFFQC